jgi:hypothetical protein
MEEIDRVIGLRINRIPLMVDGVILYHTGTKHGLAMAQTVGSQLGRAEGMLTTLTFLNSGGRDARAVKCWFDEVDIMQSRMSQLVNSMPPIRGEMGDVAAQARSLGYEDTACTSLETEG